MKKKLIIFGSAPCLESDLSQIVRLDDYDFMAVGVDAICNYDGDVQFIVTNHLEDIPVIREIKNETLIISYKDHPFVDWVEPSRPPSGSSALTGALAALSMGYKKIILCGCPLTGNAPEGNPYEAFRPGWEARKNELSGLVKSMSGWTKELLGPPPEDWING